MIGAATFFWVIAIATAIGLIDSTLIDIGKLATFEEKLLAFLAGCLILGVVCSGGGAYLWNRASTLLPLPLAGQLTTFETVFVLVLVLWIEQRPLSTRKQQALS